MYLANSDKAISIDIGSTFLHIVEGSYKKGAIVIDGCICVPTPSDTVEDGKIKDAFSLAEAIRQGMTAAKMTAKDMSVTIQSTQIITRELNVPKTDESAIKNMIKYEMEQYLPGNSQGYAVESSVINEFDNSGVRNYRMRAAAMPNDMAQSYLDLIKCLKKKPKSLDLHANVISKLFASASGEPEAGYNDKPVAYIDLGSSSINVHIFAKGRLDLTRAIMVNPNDAMNAFARVLGCNANEVTPDKMKSIDLMTLSTLSGESMEYNLLNKTISGWFSEVLRVIQYYLSRNIGIELNSAILFGGFSNLTGIIDYAKNIMSFSEVSKLSRLNTSRFFTTDATVEAENFINAAGALIRLTEAKKK